MEGPRLKVRRAMAEIHELSVFKETFRQSPNYEVVPAETNPHTGNQVWRVRVHSEPVVEWGVWIGEIAHNLRSALDQLVWQLALLKTNTPARNAQFPIFSVGKTTRKRSNGQLIAHFENTRNSKGRLVLGDGRQMIRDLSPEHQAMIERFQPYKRGGSGGHGRHNLLYLLSEINNADKHRLIQVIGAKPQSVGISGGTTQDISISPNRYRVLKDGAKLMETAPGVQVESRLIVSMAFWEGCIAVKRRPVIQTLARIAEHVGQIIESFSPAFR